MFHSTRPLDLLRSLVYLSLLGLAVTVLIGPALAVAGVLLPFLLIGALVWGVYRLSVAGLRWVQGKRPRLVMTDVAPAATPTPVPVLFRPAVEERPTSQGPSRLRSLARTALYVGIEVGCGAALGAALCVLVNSQSGAGIGHPALGAAIGAVVGFVVGGSRPESASVRVEESTGATSQVA